MAAEPRVSFVLPAYKRAFLKEAIASVLAQTCRDFELIVVDDCSPENLQEVLADFDDPRLSYRRNERNLGGANLVDAWTHAMTFARGEWCVLASDDDLYEPSYLAEMLRLTEAYPTCDLFHSRPARIAADGRWLRLGDARVAFETQIQMTHARAVLGLQQTAPDFMFRRSAWERQGGFVKFPLAWYSDDATWISLARNGVACSPEVLFLCRTSGVNISARTDNLLAKIDAAERFKTWLAERVPQMVPQGKVDAFLKERLLTEAQYRVDLFTDEELDQLGLRSWARVFLALSGFGFRRRLHLLACRLKKTFGLRRSPA